MAAGSALNGKAREAELDPEQILGPEEGMPWDDEAVFGDFQDGKVFDYDRWSAKDFTEMLDRDGKAKTVEQALTLPIRRTPWDIEPAEGDSGEAELIKKALCTPANAGGMSVPMNHVIGQATSAFGLRKAFFEKVFRRGEGDLEGRVIYDKIAFRPASMCQIARDARTGSFAGFRQKPRWFDPDEFKSVDWIDIAPQRAFVYVHGQHRDPMRGYSDLEIVLWCYRTKQKLRYLWYAFLEGQALPKSIVSSKDYTQAKKAASTLRHLKNSGIVAIPDGITIDPYESSGKGAEQFVEAIKFLDGEMSGSVLAGFTDLTSSAAAGKGSFALSKDSSDFFLKSRQAVLAELEESINSHLVSDLVKWNFGTKGRAPRFTFGQLAEADVADAIQLLTAMAASTANNLPAEFTYMLASKVAEYLDLDVEKLNASFEEHAKQKEEQAKAMAEQMQNPAMAAAVSKGSVKPEVAAAASKMKQVGRAAGVADAATRVVQKAKAGASLSEYERHSRTYFDLAARVELADPLPPAEDVPEAILVLGDDGDFYDLDTGALVLTDGAELHDEVLLAAVNGHHVPGTAYHWFHGWKPRYAHEAIKYRKGKATVARLQAEGKLFGTEPDWYQGLKPGEPTTKKVGTSAGQKTEVASKVLKGGQVRKGMKTTSGKEVVGVHHDPDGGTIVTVSDPAQPGGTMDIYIGPKSSLLVQSGKTTVPLGLKPIAPGDEGGTNLPFEGKGQTSKVAGQVIKEAEEFFGTPKGGPAKLAGAKLEKAERDAAKAAAEQEAKDRAKFASSEAAAYEQAKQMLAAPGTGPKEVKHYLGLMEAAPDQTPSQKGSAAGIRRALAEHEANEIAKAHDEAVKQQKKKSYLGAGEQLAALGDEKGVADLEKSLAFLKSGEAEVTPTEAEGAIAGIEKALQDYKSEKIKGYEVAKKQIDAGHGSAVVDTVEDLPAKPGTPGLVGYKAGLEQAVAEYEAEEALAKFQQQQAEAKLAPPPPKSTSSTETGITKASELVKAGVAKAKESGKTQYGWKQDGKFHLGPAAPGDAKPVTFHPDGSYESQASKKYMPLETPTHGVAKLNQMPSGENIGYAPKKYKTASGAMKGATKRAADMKSPTFILKSDPGAFGDPTFKVVDFPPTDPGGEYVQVNPDGSILHVKSPGAADSGTSDPSKPGTKAWAKAQAEGIGGGVIGLSPGGKYGYGASQEDLLAAGYSGIEQVPGKKAKPPGPPMPAVLKDSGFDSDAYEGGKTAGKEIGQSFGTPEEKIKHIEGLLDTALPNIESGEEGWDEPKTKGVYAGLWEELQKAKAEKGGDPDTSPPGPSASPPADLMAKAKQKATAETTNLYVYQDEDGDWQTTPHVSKIPTGAPAKVAKWTGKIEDFDPDYDTKAKQVNTPEGYHPPPPKIPKGESTGKPIGKIDHWEVNKLPPVDPSQPISEDEVLWGPAGQSKLIAQWWAGHEAGLSAKSKAGLTKYTGNGFKEINGFLRGDYAGNPSVVKAVKGIDDAMEPLPATMQVHRGLSHVNFWPEGNLEGQVVRDAGYGSTSFSSGFGGPVKLHITVPAGIKAVPVKNISQHSHENELLLARGTGYQVISDRIDSDGVRHLDVVAVPPPDPDPYDPFGG